MYTIKSNFWDQYHDKRTYLSLFVVYDCFVFVVMVKLVFSFKNVFVILFGSVMFSIIMKTRPCNIQRFFSASKIENFFGKKLIFFLFLLKT